jgi:hypothetical protein
MNRSLLVLALLLVPAPGYSMTASVTSTTPPATAPVAPANSATKAAAPAKATTAPGAASVTRPAASLAAPGVPMKSTAVASGRTGTASSKASAFMPSAATAAVAPAPSNAAWAVGDSAGMHRGTLEAINVGAGTFNVFGQKLSFNAQRVKVFKRDGKAGSVFTLKPGASIRFTLDPADAQHRRVAVIYVD